MNKLLQFIDDMNEDGKYLQFDIEGDLLYCRDKDGDGPICYENSMYNDLRIGFINYIGIDTERGLKTRKIREKDRDQHNSWSKTKSEIPNLEGLNYELELWFKSYRMYFTSMEDLKSFIKSIDIDTLMSRSIENTKLSEELSDQSANVFRKIEKIGKENIYFDKIICKKCGCEYSAVFSKIDNKPLNDSYLCDYICGLSEIKNFSREEVLVFYDIKEDKTDY